MILQRQERGCPNFNFTLHKRSDVGKLIITVQIFGCCLITHVNDTPNFWFSELSRELKKYTYRIFEACYFLLKK